MTGSVWRGVAGSGAGEDATAVDALGSSAGESARLQRQADELAPDSAALLDRVGLRAGQAAIDLGCGPRGILDLLDARVSPGGQVVGLDADPAHTAMAARFAADRALGQVEIVTADARNTGLAARSFDLVHARTLLVNLPDPAAVVTEMVRLAKPGGAVAVAVLRPVTESVVIISTHLQVTGQGLVGGGVIGLRDNHSVHILQKQPGGQWQIISEMFSDARRDLSYINHS